MSLPVLFTSITIWLAVMWTFPWPEHVNILRLIEASSPGSYYWLKFRYYVMALVGPYIAIYAVVSWVSSRVSTYGKTQGSSRENYLPATGKGLTVQLGTVNGKPLVMPEAGLHLGTAIVAGKGWGKSVAVIDVMDQLVAYEADNPVKKTGGILFELKGTRLLTACREIFQRYGREDDLIVVGPDNWTYNPVDFPLMDPFFIASSLGSIKMNVGNPSMDSFWDDTAIDVVDFAIRLLRMSREYHTLKDIYDMLLDLSKIGHELDVVEQKLMGPSYVLVDEHNWAKYKGIRKYGDFTLEPERELMGTKGWWVAPNSKKLLGYLEGRARTEDVEWHTEDNVYGSREDIASFEHLESWFKSWHNLENKLRESIAKGPQTFFKAFAADQMIRSTFCPPEDSPNRVKSFGDEIEKGKWIVLSFGDKEVDGKVLKTASVLCKLAFESYVNHRVSLIDQSPDKYWRNVGMVADEFQIIASAGGKVPVGDETFFNVGARSGRCMVFATFQGSNSMHSAIGEHWQTVVQGLENKIFGRLNGPSADWASKEAGKDYVRVRNYNITETSHDTGISPLGGRPVASKSGIGTSKSYNEQLRDRVLPSEFMGLPNFEGYFLGCDGTRAVGPVRFRTKGLS